VHLYGLCADMEPLREMCASAGAAVVEDAAQSLGASRGGVPSGAFAQAGCFSFYPTKPLGGFGDGGLVATSDAELAAALRIARTHGDAGGYRFVAKGGNFRLDALQAAALRVKLPYVEAWRKEREEAARWYVEALGNAGLEDRVTWPAVPGEGETHAFALYTVRARDRDGLLQHLRDRGIGCAVYYPRALHLQPAFADLGHGEGDFPESERAAREVLSLPMFSGITRGQVDEVVEGIRGFYSG
jgi:dTDP-4-amino-4,6-dideoxygalactose transaminase